MKNAIQAAGEKERVIPKEDQRVRITKSMIREAFIRLMQEKPLPNITVKELCGAAQVSRGTFYLHYLDIYDLLDKLENEMLTELDEMLNTTSVIGYANEPEASAAFLEALFGFFERNREMCAILLGDNGDKKFVAGIVESAREKSVRKYLDMYPGVTREQAETFYYFIAWGFIGLVQYSLRPDNYVLFDTLVASAGKIIAEGARFFTDPPK